jgi:hypothetical protein
MKKIFFAFLFVVSTFQCVWAATGDWRAYMAYHDITEIAPAGKIIYVLSTNNLFAYNTADQSVTTFDKVTSLSDSYITHIAYNKSVKKLIVTYANENIDLIDDNFKVTNISDIYSKAITEDKTINSIFINGIYAYLSTNFGVIKLNMRDAEIADTYNLGVIVKSCTILNNMIYISSSSGIYLGNQNDNLLDKSNWKLINSTPLIGFINYQNTLVGYDSNTILTLNTSTNEMHVLLSGQYAYHFLNDDHLIIGNSSLATVFQSISDEHVIKTNGYTKSIIYDATNKCYWNNGKDGVLAASSIDGDTLQNTLSDIVPNSPRRNFFYHILWKDGILYCAGGGINSLDRFSRPGSIYSYDGDKWLNYDEDSVTANIGRTYLDIDHIAVDPADANHIFATSGGQGVYEFNNGKFVKHYNNENSPMHSVIINKDSTEDQNYIRVDGATFDNEGNFWFLNSFSKNALIEYTKDKEWKTYNNKKFFYNDGDYSYYTLRSLFFDSRGLIWFVNAHWLGPCVICYNPTTDEAVRYSSFVNQDGTTLEITYVYCAAEDKDGNIWVGTNKGPLLLTADEISSGGTTFTQVKIPRNDGSNYADYLLNGVSISCITVDGGNRKWFGTQSNGVYLISADNMEMVHHFMAENSNLLSDNIESIAINSLTGETFFGTDKGMTSYMSDANEPKSEMTKDNVYAYPNPVKPDYTGLITVTGLTFNADIKIVTANGIKVAEGKSNGGLFTWDGCDKDGKRVASGIYNVVTAKSDGTKGTVCKIAIIK